jgi:hypothetical protein
MQAAGRKAYGPLYKGGGRREGRRSPRGPDGGPKASLPPVVFRRGRGYPPATFFYPEKTASASGIDLHGRLLTFVPSQG